MSLSLFNLDVLTNYLDYLNKISALKRQRIHMCCLVMFDFDSHALIQINPSVGGVLTMICFKGINVFHRWPYAPPSRSNWTQGVQLLPEGVCTRFSKESYSHL